MADGFADLNAAIRKAAGVSTSIQDEVAAARARLEAARASGDPATIEQATQEAENVAARGEGRGDPDFGAGARRSIEQPPDMSALMRQSLYGAR